jgi:molybdopterin converting factor small subunit
VRVEVKLFQKFKEYLPPDSKNGKATVTLEDGSTLGDLVRLLGIPLEEPKLVIVNGISRGISDTLNVLKLNEGDTVAVFPPSGGG